LSSRPQTKSRVGRPVGSDRDENTAKIIQAAVRSFGEKGFAATSFADISQAVGFTRSAVYSYYPNKTHLYQAALDTIQAEHLHKLKAAMTDDAPFPARLARVLAVFVADHEQQPERARFLSAVSVEICRHPELLDARTGTSVVLDSLIAFFQQAIDNGEINSAFDPQDLLIALFGGVLGMSLLQHGTGRGSMARAVDVVLAGLIGELLTPEGGISKNRQ
jgi:AcrR family transcriptional regulator